MRAGADPAPPMIRVLLPVPPSGPRQVRVEGARFHHLVHVLRRSVGDAVEVFDGKGRSFPAEIVAIDADGALLALGKETRSRPLRPIALVQGLPKLDKLEAILQKGTELGAAAFAPVKTARSVVRLTEERAAQKARRWSKIVEEAARQCGRSDVPRVHPPRDLLDAARELAEGAALLVLDEEETAVSLAQAFSPLRAGTTPIALIVGPEGGLARGELRALCDLGATPVTLGARILRTETASLAALAVLLHLEGELG